MASLMQQHRLYPDQSIVDPYSPNDLAGYGLQPLNDHCGHLEGSTGITGAAPIWNAYMKTALAGAPKDWYQRPPDVVAAGGGDDGEFFLPGSAEAAGGCWYYAPAPDPNNQCAYRGVSPPKASATPAPSPAPQPPAILPPGHGGTPPGHGGPPTQPPG